jgi:hypothetical protein
VRTFGEEQVRYLIEEQTRFDEDRAASQFVRREV